MRGSGGGGGGGVGSRGDAARHATRTGDWTCPKPACRFAPNFASRSSCFKCGAARPGGARGEAVGGSQRLIRQGPVGAGGSRPLLTAWGNRCAVAAPTHRVPGSSLAAEALAAAREPSIARAGGGGKGGAAVPRVDHRGGAKGLGRASGDAMRETEGGAGKPGGGQPAAQDVPQGEGPRSRGRWADDAVPADGPHAGGGDDDSDDYLDDVGWEEEGDEGAEDGASPEPDPSELKARWQQECKVVRTLEASGAPADSAALAAARTARDDAERLWRSAKEPRPVATRIGWAQQRLDKAEKALTKLRFEVEEYEEEVLRQRRAFDERLEAAEGRYRWRRDQLDELYEEASGQGAARVNEDLCDMVAKEVAAMVELMEDGTEAKGMGNLLLSRIAEAAHRRQGAKCEEFNLAEADCTPRVCRGGSPSPPSDRAQAGGGAEGQAAARPAWAADSSGRWQHRGRGAGASSCGVDGAAVGASPCGKGGSGAAAADMQVDAASDVAVRGRPSGVRGRDDEVQDQQPASKSHRGEDVVIVPSVESAADDVARAHKLRQEQATLIQAAEGARATFGDATSVHIAAQLYAHKVALAVQRANAVDIGATVDGKQLIELAPDKFTAWVEEVLVPAEKEATGAQDL